MPAPTDQHYYVYVYIDPRNLEEFYYGKGKGSRRTAHLDDTGRSDKTERIRAIKNEGLTPTIKTVAAGLTEHDAFLIETTLIWRLGRALTNLSAGRYVSLFRPQNTLHKQLANFDFQNAIYYFNVGEGPDHRRWEDCKRLGFLSAGGGKRWRDQILDISPGDVLIAYLKGHGYVGVGQVTQRARPYLDVRIKGKLLDEIGPSNGRMSNHSDDLKRCEYPILVDWVSTVSRDKAKWKRKSGLFTTQHVKASLDNQPKTIAFIEREFDVKLGRLIRRKTVAAAS
jgi:LEM3-like protein